MESQKETAIGCDRRTDKQKIMELLTEALSGTSTRSKVTILREAMKIVSQMK